MEKEVLIFGHKNPDTDSICSSLVHESLNEKVGWKAKAVRLGKLNKETQYVLNYLGIKEDNIYLIKFYENLLLGKNNNLSSEDLIVKELF